MEVATYGLQVVSLDMDVNKVLIDRVKNNYYEGFVGITLSNMDVLLLFDSVEHRNKAYNDINHNTNNPEEVIVALVLPTIYVDEKDLKK